MLPQKEMHLILVAGARFELATAELRCTLTNPSRGMRNASALKLADQSNDSNREPDKTNPTRQPQKAPTNRRTNEARS